MLNEIFNAVFGWALYFGKPWDIILISGALTLLITLAYKYLTDQARMSHLKSEQKRFQEEMKNCNDNTKKMELQKQSLQLSWEYMRHSWKPMFYTFIPLILIFGWVRTLYPDINGIKTVLIPFPLFGGFGWLGTYIIASIIASMIFRKLLRVY